MASRTIKAGLTKATGELGQLRDRVGELEAALAEELSLVEQILRGDRDRDRDRAPAPG
jgi:hypothetical protein